MYEIYLFDLDGTLTDSSEGIINSVLYALEQFGVHESDRTKLKAFIGPPLLESYQKYYGFTEDMAKRGIEEFRAYFEPKGMFENQVYPGIPELLKALKDAGKKVGLVTSKPEFFAVKILEHFDLYQYFDFCTGATIDESRAKKQEVLAYGLDQFGIEDLSKCVMIGDRKYDIQAARACGIDSIGVLYGFGSREELEEAGATYIAETVEDLLKVLFLPAVS